MRLQRPGYDDAHRIIQVGLLHLLIDVDLSNLSYFHKNLPPFCRSRKYINNFLA